MFSRCAVGFQGVICKIWEEALLVLLVLHTPVEYQHFDSSYATNLPR